MKAVTGPLASLQFPMGMLPKALIRLLVVLGIGWWLAATAIVAGLVIAGRDAAVDRATQSSVAFAFGAGEYTELTFATIDLTLNAIADAYRRAPPMRPHDPEFRAVLERAMQGLPHVSAIFIIGPDGWPIHHSGDHAVSLPWLGDRDYFRLHQGDPSIVRSISLPIFSRAGAGWVLPVTHRLETASGGFGGIVAAAVQTDYFQEFFKRMALGKGDAIALFHRDGALIARHPPGDADEAGESVKDELRRFAELARDSDGVHVTGTDKFADQRIVSYRSVERTPLVVSVSRDLRYGLAEWRRTAIGAAVAIGGLTVMLAVFIGFLIQEHRRWEAVRQHQAQAEKLEAMGQLTGGIAHDFANLLNIVSLSLQHMRRKSADVGQTVDEVAIAERAIVRGSDLIGRLLVFARRQPLQIAPMDLNVYLADASGLLSQAAGTRINIVIDLAEHLPWVVCDTSQLEVALVNLMVNARDAISGTGRIRFHTYECADDLEGFRPGTDYVCVAVEDNGPGMPEAVRQRALEPFFTTKGEAGTGLGLSQVYGFMRQIGGGVRIDSVEGRGTTVNLYFRKASEVPPRHAPRDTQSAGIPPIPNPAG